MKKKIKILFLGNSLTYVNFLPLAVKKFFRKAGIDAETVMITQGGKCLDWHLTHRDTEFNVKYGGYDYVVLQGKATGFDPDSFVDAGTKIINDMIKPAGSVPVLYLAWSLRGESEKQPVMTGAYKKLSEATGALLAPAGEVWQRALRLRPAPDIYMPDGNHPTPAGTYLCAATIFYTVTGRRTALPVSERGGIFEEYGLDAATARKINALALSESARFPV